MASSDRRRPIAAALALVAATLAPAAAPAAEYAGPIIDVHSHLSSPAAIDAYAAAARRHNVVRVVLLGVGGVQKDDAAWIAGAARTHPDLVVPGVPVPDPMAPGAAPALDAALGKGRARIAGEVHVRQMGSRRIERDPSSPAFGRILETVARHGVPLVIHYELTDEAAAALDRALAAHRKATVVLAHAGEGPASRIRGLLERNPNLLVDLSGMHFQRKPALATETGPLDPQWKALIEAMPDRFLAGIDVWAPRLFEPKMLDRLMTWTRRILGELRPDVAERVAHRNAARLLRLE